VKEACSHPSRDPCDPGTDGPATLAALRGCRLCAERFAVTATTHAPRPVFQVDPRARLLIASQAPGARAHASGLPFDDPSGDRLRHWMAIDRATFYDAAHVAIVPMAFCFPGYDAKGSDLPPPPLCARTWRGRLLALLPELRLTLLVGAHAQRWHLGQAAARTLTGTVADWRAFGPEAIPLPHPSWRNTAWLKRNPWFEAEVLPTLRVRIAALLAT
jgi:uracil-DNA glycosylase